MKILKITKDFIAVNKPSGLPTTYKNKEDHGDCLVKRITEKHPELLKVSGYKAREGGLLYRLDNETTGLVIFARNEKFFNKFIKLQENKKLYKHYYAISENSNLDKQKLKLTKFGFIQEKTWLNYGSEIAKAPTPKPFNKFNKKRTKKYLKLNLPIGHSKKNSKKMTPMISSNYKCQGKEIPAITFIHIEDQINQKLLVKAIINKGARHQIRLHLESLGLPILGDPLYSKRKKENLKLHCYSVTLLK